MRTNATAKNTEKTYEGAPARILKPAPQLLRQVATCMLFEDTFYAKGSTIAGEIADSAAKADVRELADIAFKARTEFKLRHVPLFLLAQLDKRRAEVKGLLAATVEKVVQRPDELAETLSILQKVNPGRPLKKILSAGMKKGLARAFRKFSRYQLAKWNRNNEIKLRDVLFLTHPKPKDAEQAEVWKALVDGTLEAPDTWEVALSAGADKKATWERLLAERKLGYMALLMNLRAMEEAKVDRWLVEAALLSGAKDSRALPFRFVTAAKFAPAYAQALSDAMLQAIEPTKLPGSTAILVDISGSMDITLSAKSQLTRWEAAAALSILVREVCEYAQVFTFSAAVVEVQNYRGLPLMAAMGASQLHGDTALSGALRTLFSERKMDRLIVVTDEESQDGIIPPLPGVKSYLVNVAPYRAGLELSGGWTRFNGFSERVVDYIRWEEAQQ